MSLEPLPGPSDGHCHGEPAGPASPDSDSVRRARLSSLGLGTAGPHRGRLPRVSLAALHPSRRSLGRGPPAARCIFGTVTWKDSGIPTQL